VTTRAQTARRPMLAALPRFSQQISRVAQWIVVALFGVWIVGNILSAPEQVLSVLLLGITYGAIYALVALGYTLVYGIIELINFAHGDVFMLGTMTALTLITFVTGAVGARNPLQLPVPLLILSIVGMLVLSAVVCATINVLIERIAYRRLRNAPRLAPLISAIGMSFILINIGLIWKSPRQLNFPDVIPRIDIFQDLLVEPERYGNDSAGQSLRASRLTRPPAEPTLVVVFLPAITTQSRYFGG
jgi:branched-chain amino acid transport system permease protein